MPSFARYYASRARRQCVTCGRQSATPYCPECLSRQRASNAASYQRHKARRAEEREAALLDRPHAIAHCGQWHLFASLPVRCEVCRTILLQGDMIVECQYHTNKQRLCHELATHYASRAWRAYEWGSYLADDTTRYSKAEFCATHAEIVAQERNAQHQWAMSSTKIG